LNNRLYIFICYFRSRSTGPRECSRDYKSYGMFSYMQKYMQLTFMWLNTDNISLNVFFEQVILIQKSVIFTDGRSSRNGTQSGSASSRESHSLLDTSQTRKVSMLPPVLKSASQSGAINHKAMSEQEFTKAYNSILKHYMEEPIIEVSTLEI